ncbi:transposase [Legionella santicrucis]|uniref:Transposase n=1 Tax=Legionella santicrucis TaxID=45074 RepID=A0A0W0Z215_9GAMM|nr:transposase [Legionella santicrucis]
MWISEEVIAHWYAKDRVYDGTGTPILDTDFAIIICHKIPQVYRLHIPLDRERQFQKNQLFCSPSLGITVHHHLELSFTFRWNRRSRSSGICNSTRISPNECFLLTI